jgi:alpha-glucosidase
MKTLPCLLALCLAFCYSLPAAPTLPEPQAAADQLASTGTLTLDLESRQVEIRLCRPDLVRIATLTDGHRTPEGKAIARTQWEPVQVKVLSSPNQLLLVTSALQIAVARKDGRIALRDLAGTTLISEHETDGVYSGWQKGVHFETLAGSHFYGLKGWEYLDDSHGQMELRPSAQPYAIRAGAEGATGGPLVWSNRGYGVFIDTDGGLCHIRSDRELRFYDLTAAGLTYYLMAGSAPAIQQIMIDLTGVPPLFPKWAVGFSNSEFADMNEELCARNVEGYRSRGIPIDLYTFDFQWKDWGSDHYGELRWNPVNFPNGPSGDFAKRMAAQGIKLAGIMKPRIHVESEQGRYATEHGFWVKGRPPYADYFSKQLTNDLEFSIPECRRWFWEHAAGAFDSGIVGWWNDEADAWGSTWEGFHMAQAMYEGQRAHTQDRVRVWTNNRNYYSGSQRFAYATWSGDIESGFEVMAQQRERLLCSVNVGQARWAMDAGGFNNNYHIAGEELNESFARWIEFAAFVPIFRTHGTSYRQPWLYGPKAEAAARRAVRLRYALLPYLYSYDRQLHETGVGLVRPLVWAWPDDPKLANHVDAWLFGEHLLVAPVIERGQTSKAIYLPEGEWIDYFRGTRIHGGRTLDYAVDAQSWQDIPLFIREGAIIPTVEVQNYVGEKRLTGITIDVFPARNESSFVYYDDDGTSYAYEKGAYFRQAFHTQATAKGARLSLAAATGSYRPEVEWYTFRIHQGACQAVRLNGAALPRVKSVAELNAATKEAWTNETGLYGGTTVLRLRPGQALEITLTR